jgi:hypothetical protein
LLSEHQPINKDVDEQFSLAPIALHAAGMEDAPVSDDLHEEVVLDPLSLRGKLCITVRYVIT